MTQVPDRSATIDRALAWHRDQLLELSTKNPLLHFPTRDGKGKLKPRRLEAQGLSPDELYRALVIEGRRIVLRGSRDAVPEDDDGLPALAVTPGRGKNDVVLTVPLTEEDLHKRLAIMQRTEREFLEEQGVHCLYLTLGHLRWYEERKQGDVYDPRLAPLLMVPVHLDRSARTEPLRLVYTGEDMPGNFTLNLKLRELGLAVPELPDPDDLVPSAYLQAVRDALHPKVPSAAQAGAGADDWFTPASTASQAGAERPWSVDDTAIALGFFSFAKILMYHDLLPERWPAGLTPHEHPLVAPLLAGHTADEQLPPSASVDDVTTGPGVWHVLDADSSQAEAIGHVLQGHHLVLQGPPGTGKSQTITNMIAGLVAQGKKVLFVAEKEAALSVVEERLRKVGLAHAVLALHSKNASKATLRDSLHAALKQARDAAVTDAGEDARLGALVEQLQALPAALNEPLPPLTVTPYDVMGRLQDLDARLQGAPALPRTPAVPAGVLTWTAAQWAEAEQVTQELAQWITRNGPPARLTLWGSAKRSEFPQDRARLDAAAAELAAALDALQPSVSAFAPLAARPPDTLADLTEVSTALTTLQGAPNLAGLNTGEARWSDIRAAFAAAAATAERHAQTLAAVLEQFPAPAGAWSQPTTWTVIRGSLRQLLDLGVERQTRRTALLGRVQPAALNADVAAVRSTLEGNRGFLSVFSGAVRDAKRQLQGWMRASGPLDGQLALLREVEEYQALGRQLQGLTGGLHGWTFADEPDYAAARGVLTWLDRPDVAGALAAGWPVVPAARQGVAALLAGRAGDPLPALEQLLAMEAALHAAVDDARGLLGAQARGLDTPWRDLVTTAEWLATQRAAHPHWAPVLATLAGPPEARVAFTADAARFTEQLDRAGAAAREFGVAAELPDVPAWTLTRLRDVARAVAADAQALRRAVSWNQLHDRLARLELSPLADAVQELDPEVAGRTLLPAVLRQWNAALLDDAFAQRPALSAFEAQGHEDKRAAFRTLDLARFRLNQQRVRHAYLRTVPQPGGAGQVGILQREFAKKKRLLPVRDLLRQAGQAVQALKPVFMMSPLSIASFMPLGTLQFDVVIFDEASQVRPSDALGALLRARQAVVVGDLKQLGPTNFFSKVTEDGDAEDVPDEAGLESLLALFEAQYAGFRHGLTWHYRSQHEALIQTSNEAFYEGELVTFPNASPAQEHLGLRFHHIDPQVGSFGRGTTRVNRGEAEAVVEAVLRHARERPQESLAVVTFSATQQALIEALIDQRLPSLPAGAQGFFREDARERFVVKNLENVQGDERDVIMISVGYGYATGKTGALQMYQIFGPLGTADGWRRLNVLITRARLRIETFANFWPEELTPNDASEGHRGLRAFKLFLQRSVQSGVTGASAAGGEATGGLAGQVAQVLRGAGYTVHEQVGTSAARIELAVEHPRQPGQYVLGIELDGPAYHRSRSVRDRDRLREDVLRVFGWRLHRLWSVDWFRDPAGGAQALLAAVDRAVAGDGAVPEPVDVFPEVGPASEFLAVADDAGWFTEDVPPSTVDPWADVPSSQTPATTADLTADSYVEARAQLDSSGLDFHLIPTGRLADALADVARQEGPIHEDLALRRLMHAAGITRMGSRVREAFQRAVAEAARRGAVTAHGRFLVASDDQLWTARRRDQRPVGEQKLEYVSDAELVCAMTRVMQRAVGITAQDLPDAALNYLGFRRVTAEARERMDGLIGVAVAEGIFQTINGALTLSGG